MNAAANGAACALVFLVATGCSAVPGFGDGGESQKAEDSASTDSGATSGGTSSGGTSSGGTSSGGTSSGGDVAGGGSSGADSAAGGCSPACEVWQVCDSGLCANKPCSKDQECNAAGGPPAGVKPHYCYKAKCALFQCGKDEDCGQGFKCNDKTFLCYEAKTGCAVDADCIDSSICTSDTCDTKTGKCDHKKINGCCNADLECDDGSKCTTDTCDKQLSKCKYAAKDKCCTEDANCADSSACTTDTCDKATGQCKFAAKASCCENDGQCDDAKPSTSDSCNKGSCVHFGGGAKTCSDAGGCAKNACATASCVGGMCSHQATSKTGAPCCTADADCAATQACTESKCAALMCASTAITGKEGPWSWHMFDDSKLNGWIATNENKTATWHLGTTKKVSGAGALRYGVPGKKTWSGGFPNKGHITSPKFTVPAAGRVSFFVHFDGEPGTGVHVFGLKVVDGSQETSVWSKNDDLKGNTAGGWKAQSADLSKWAGKAVHLRWWFDVAVKFPKEDGDGLLIDELIVHGMCK